MKEELIQALEEFFEAKFNYLYYSKEEGADGYYSTAHEEKKVLDAKRKELVTQIKEDDVTARNIIIEHNKRLGY